MYALTNILESLLAISHLLALQNFPLDVGFANTDAAKGLQRLAVPVSPEFTSGQHWLRRQFLQFSWCFLFTFCFSG